MSRALASVAVLALVATPLAAQSSQFGSRGLGHPGRGLSVAALGTEGSGGLFDPGSSRNPGAFGLIDAPMTVISSLQGWRSSVSPEGEGSTREHRFPHVLIGGPVPGTSIGIGASYSNYATRDYVLVSEGMASPRGEPVAVTDSTGSLGGLSDFRVAAGWSPTPSLQVGVGVHLLTGSNRVFSNRTWADTSYEAVRQEAELTYLGTGISAGVVFSPRPGLWIGGSVRRDGALDVERDSAAVGSVSLPFTLSGGVRYTPNRSVALTGQVTAQNWATSSDDLEALGGAGAASTLEFAGGVELVRNSRRPEHLPLRLGVRMADLPFRITAGEQAREFGLSLGTGIRFAGDLGGIDLAIERVRRTQGDAWRETAWMLSVGVTLRGIPRAP